MKGIEELECTTVARWSWHLLGALWHVLWTIHPGVSHRTFGFRTLSKERHEFHTVHAAIEPNRTNKKYSNWKKSNVQSECFKKNLWDQVRMFYFPTSSIEFGHRTKWSSLQKNTSGTKSSSWSSVETSKAIWSFVSFLQSNLCIRALY